MLNLYKTARENKFLNRYKKIIKFCVCGTISAVIDLGILVFLVEVFSVNLILANTVSFSVAVVNSFLWNKFWTFRDNSVNYSGQFFKFLAVSIIGLVLNNSFLYLFVRAGMWYLGAKVIVILIVLGWNFFANNFWTFNNQKNYEKRF